MDLTNDKADSSIVINDDITVIILGREENQIRIGIEAPDDTSIWRGELYRKIEDTAKSIALKNRGRFTPPTCDEVDLYIIKKGYSGFTGEQFCSFYESKGWMVGSNKMKSWRAAVTTWAIKVRNGR